MFIIMWEFRVRQGQEIAFQRAQGANGEWARLFGRDARYLGTELLRDERDTNRYVTLDRWTSRAAYDAFRAQWQAEYRAIDRAHESLTEQEALLGMFTVGPADE